MVWFFIGHIFSILLLLILLAPPGLKVNRRSLSGFLMWSEMLSGFDDDRQVKVAPLRRSQTGSITAIIKWPHYADHQVDSLRRSQGGSIAAITEWLYSSDH